MKFFSKKQLKAANDFDDIINEEEPQKWPEDDPGSQEISKYHPAYEFLLKLINVVVKAGVNPQEIKDLSLSMPFQTVDDVGNLAAAIWTLATEKYKIPREWLIKKLPEKKSSLKQADQTRDEEWQAQKQTQDMLDHSPGYLAYNYGQDITSSPDQDKNTLLSIAQDFINDVFFTKNARWSDAVKELKDLYPALTSEDIIFLKDQAKNKINQNLQQLQATKKKPLNIDMIVKVLNQKEPKVTHVDLIKGNIELEDGTILSFDDAAKKALEMDKTSVFQGSEFSTTDWGVNPSLDNGPFSSPQDQGADDQEQPFPNTNWVPADDENKDEQPYSNVASSFKRPFSKKAGLDGRYWIAPDGTEFNAGNHHGVWVKQHADILKQYGITNAKNIADAYDKMYASGWSRISNERGFTIEVADLNRIPAYLDDFVARHYQKGDIIRIGTNVEGYDIDDPFPSLQRSVNKARRNTKASLKQADITGQAINDILQGIEFSGGITYNMSKGNLSGTDNYAVSIYPQREKIINGPVDFDMIEGYVEENKDLLNNLDNSFGAWTNNGSVYLDVVLTIPNKDRAMELAKQNNQLAIWDLKNNKEISTDIVRAFSKRQLIKKAEESLLSQEQQDQIASVYGPSMNLALNNYAQAIKNGHDKARAAEYAVFSVANIGKITPFQLLNAAKTYLVGLI